MPDINNRNEYYYDGYENNGSGLLRVLTHVSTVKEQRIFRHLQRVKGMICDVFFPVAGEYDPYNRTGSIYNKEDNKFNYRDEPDIENANIVISNLMDLTRIDAQTRMDYLRMKKDIYGYTNLESDGMCGIPENSKIVVKYNHKNYVFFVWEITALDSPYEDGKAIYQLELKPHS